MPVICITGATAGFGEAAARRFAAEGWNVIITGRRKERLDALAQELAPARVHAAAMDVRDRAAVDKVVAGLTGEFKDIDVLFNNAGLAVGMEKAQDADADDWQVMVDTNITGVLNCVQAVLPGMAARDKGHIVTVGSIAGNYPYTTGNVYAASKAFTRHFMLNLKADLLGTQVRVTSLEPGMAVTEFSLGRTRGDQDKARAYYEGLQALRPEDMAECLWWVVNLPPHMTVTRMEVWPTAQAFGTFALHKK